MSFRTLFGSLDRRISPSPARKRGQIAAGRHTATRRLRFESLEDRRLLSFSAAVDYPVGLNPQAVVAADFNGDGRLDLAVVNFSSSNVSVLLGNANGTFQPAVNSATGASPLSVAVGDFNADGKLDLATANAGDVSVLLGNGNGTFQAPTSIGIGSSPASVAVGDFNGDGKLDLGVDVERLVRLMVGATMEDTTTDYERQCQRAAGHRRRLVRGTEHYLARLRESHLRSRGGLQRRRQT